MEIWQFISERIHELAIITGCISLTLLFLLYRKFKEPLFKYTFFFLLIPQIMIVIGTLFYSLGAFTNYAGAVTAYGINFLLGSLFIYWTPMWIYKIIDKPITLGYKIFWLVVALFHMADFARKLIYFQHDLSDIDVTIILTNAQMVYIIYLLITRVRIIKIPELSLFFKTFIVITIVRIFYATFDFIIYKFYVDLRYIILHFNYNTLYQLFIAVATLYFIASYFLKPETKGEDTLAIIPREMKEILGITDRENEVITLFIDGYTSKEIGEKLFISTQTVKNYIYRVYQKANVKKKNELLQKINDMKW